MEYNIAVSDMRSGDEIEGFYILNRAEVKKTVAGKPYLNAYLSDCTGGIPARMWDFSGSVEGENGKAVLVRGSVTEFNGALQFTMSFFRPANERDKYDIRDLVPSAPIDVDERMHEIYELVATVEDDDYRAVCEKVLERHADALKSIPAAKSVHHAFLSGLLMHTSNMLRTADFLSGIYGDMLDRSLLITGTLMHDIAKEREFVISELGLVTEYSAEGDLLGHLVMGAREASEIAKELNIPQEKSMLLQHMILSHHGTPELGAAVVPHCAESELLSMIDRLDAHMEVYREALKNTPEGKFSDRIFALDKKIYNHG